MFDKELLSFSEDIQKLDPLECDAKAIDLINYIEEKEYKLEDYKYLHFYATFNGLVDSNGILREDFRHKSVNESKPQILTEATTKSSSKRDRVTNLILDSISLVDKTGLNVKKYKSLFDGMNDDQFKKYMDDFTSDPDKNFYLEILPNKSEPTITDIEKLLSKLNIPKEEYVYYRDDGFKDDPLRSKEKCSVGYVNVRRLQQILSKKNTYSLDIDNRDSKTGQVTGADKIARISDAELYGLTVFKADHAIKEFYTARADNMVAKADMYGKISKYGYVYLEELQSDKTKNQTLNTINTYLLGAGIQSDLIEDEASKAKKILTKQVIDAELNKMSATGIKKEDTLLNEESVLTEYFVVYPTNKDGQTLNPRIPKNYMTQHGFEDNKTNRVPASSSISGCLKGLSKNLKGAKLFVHKIISSETPYIPLTSEVPDKSITGEVWFKNSVKLKCIGEIFVSGDDGKSGIPYTFGPDKKVAKLYGWNYNWVQKFNTSQEKPAVSDYDSFIKTESVAMLEGINIEKNITKLLNMYNPSKIYLSSDYHIFKEDVEELSTEDADKIRKIITNHNQVVGEDDLFIFLGDISHPNISPIKYRTLCSMIQAMNGKKIMITGIADDNLSVESYYNMGFTYVTDRFSYNDILFTHCPVPNKFFGEGIRLNIHGHIHGSRDYSDGHIDVYIEDPIYNYSPMNIPNLLKLYNKGHFKGISKSQVTSFRENSMIQEEKYVYLALTEAEQAKGYIDYELQEGYNGKYANITLEGLEEFLLENKLTGEYKYYTKIAVKPAELMVYDEFSDNAVLRLPFARDVEESKELFIKGVKCYE